METVWQLLMQNGITLSEVEMIKHAYLIIIMIPIVTTILAVLRYIVGIKSPNLFALLILTFSLLDLGFQGTQTLDFIQGLKYGSLLYLVVFVTATICYAVIRRWRMHYIPKMSIVFTVVAVGYILLIMLSRFADSSSILLTNSFVVVIIATLAENIVTSFARKDFKYSFDMSLRTYLVAVFSFIVISLDIVRNIFINYPYLILVLLVINIYIGKFKGLRLTEYFRFKSVLLSNTSTDEQNKPNTTK